MIVRRYWQPFQEMNSVKQQLDQLFEEFSGTETASTTWTPAATLIENEEALTLQLQLPGVNPEEIDIQASREVVAIAGNRQSPELAEGDTLRRSEFRYGSFRRIISLPVAIDPKDVSAQYEAGILIVTLPKAEDERNKVVKVSVAGSHQQAIAQAAEANVEAEGNSPEDS